MLCEALFSKLFEKQPFHSLVFDGKERAVQFVALGINHLRLCLLMLLATTVVESPGNVAEAVQKPPPGSFPLLV
jgi:hypothetical protein